MADFNFVGYKCLARSSKIKRFFYRIAYFIPNLIHLLYLRVKLLLYRFGIFKVTTPTISEEEITKLATSTPDVKQQFKEILEDIVEYGGQVDWTEEYTRNLMLNDEVEEPDPILGMIYAKVVERDALLRDYTLEQLI